MYSQLQDKSFVVCGFVARDAELKQVGEKKSSLCRWSVKAGEKLTETGEKEPIWVSCQAWHDTARLAANIKKGDTVFCVGRLEKNEYQGKIYKNLVCEYISIMGKAAAAPAPAPSATAESENIDLNEFEEILSDGEVPF